MTSILRDQELLDGLAAAVGQAHVLRDPAVKAGYETDWTGRFNGSALAVVRPGSTGEVAEVLRLSREAATPIVPQGGNTGLVGGGVPRGGEVIVSLRRLKDLEPVDEVAGEVTAGAGVTLAELHEHARAAGFDFGIDFAARQSATVGGMIATNAGGARLMRYGPMRAQLIGIEAVTAGGELLRRLPGILKDNTGYHLPSLLAGSEGTLAVITRARLRLIPHLVRRATALLGLADTAAVLAVVARLRHRLASLEAAEVFYDDGLQLVLDHLGDAPPFEQRHPAYLLVECAAHSDPTDDLASALADAPEIGDAVLANDQTARERLWRLREWHSEAINARGVPHKLDVSVPTNSLAEFERRVRGVAMEVRRDALTVLFGHVGDGNFHVNVLGPEPGDETVDDAVLGLVVELGGSVSAEHGIGVAKTRWLVLNRAAGDVRAMRAIKRALDPWGLLNPGVLLSAD
ncbi:MAG: FAD-binding oxidoreductase [Chloroflexota bacterium]|nr:FAD-binding oxidoreductase [Chloroflexota bacterium]